MSDTSASKGKVEPSSLPKMRESAVVRDLASSISKEKRESTFACGGRVPVDAGAKDGCFTKSKPVDIRFGSHGKGSIFTVSSTARQPCKLDDLLAACNPASFGRGGEAVLDNNYRMAGKLDLNEYSASFCPYAVGIIDVVSQLLLPNAVNGEPRAVRAELYKLNVYSAPDGKFKAHVDTLRSITQFGSLVVALPVVHTGGELIVRCAGKGMNFDWSSDAYDEHPVVSWAAFYGDCEHEVLEVTSGHPVALTYNLYAVTPASGHFAGNMTGLLDATQLPLYRSLQYALTNPTFFPSGNEYDYSEDEDGNVDVGSSIFVGTQFHRPIFVDFTLYDESHDEWVDHIHSTFKSEQYGPGEVEWLNDKGRGLREPAIAYATYGNEPSLDVQYSSAVLLINIPPLVNRISNTSAASPTFDGIATDESK